MLMNRVIGAFMFRKGVYAEVERDASFTQTAWMLVVVISFLNAVGTYATTDGFGNWLIATIVGTIFAVLGFAVGAFVISFIGKSLFNAAVDFGEVVRVVGLAYVWRLIGFLGILGIIPVLGCIIGPVVFLAAIMGFVAWLIAVKEALDLDWGRTIVTVIVAWIAVLVVSLIAGFILSAIGIAGAGLMGAFGG
jgi:hypothetical protein